MRLDSLEVRDFRGVPAATITFGPGLTVLHGPNELGKSTLVEAIHAALFVQATSQAGNDYVTWGGSAPACVTLTFEHEGKLWRVSKRFGRRAEAKLESSAVESPRFREVVSGRGVDGKLRELLAWGIAPPGGRGAAPKAESFLLTALVGRQGEVQAIFDTSLDDDREDTGKSLVTRALGALDHDPIVSRILDTLRSRVEAVFNATGGLRTAADSPLVQLQQRLRTQKDTLERLQADEARGSGIQAQVVRLQDNRERLLDEAETANATLTAAKAQVERARQRSTLQAEIDDVQAQLGQADTLAARLTLIDGQIVTARANTATLKEAEGAAALALEAIRRQLQAAAEAIARASEAAEQSERVKGAALAQRRAELEMARTTAEARLSEVAAAEQAAAEAARLEQQFNDASSSLGSAVAAATEAKRALEHAATRAALEEWLKREEAATRATQSVGEAQGREQVARERLDAAAAAVADAERRREGGELELQSQDLKDADAETLLLHAVESQIVIANLRANVHALEEATQRARTLRGSAQARRSEASDIESAVASRVLPTREQVAAWRDLERELKTDSSQAPAAPPSPLVPAILVAAATFAVVTAGLRFGLGWSLSAALLAGVVAAALAGGLTWVGLRGRGRLPLAEQEHEARRRDRWTQEVEPRLRAAGLATLADYEGAVADLERQKVEIQRLRNQADRNDLDAGEAERTAAPLESRRDELERLERERPAGDAVAVTQRAQAFGGDVDRVRLRLGEIRTTREAARARLHEAAAAIITRTLEERGERQSEYDTAARLLTAAETTLNLARDQCNPEEVARLRTRLAEIGDAPSCTVAEATTAFDGARVRQTEASTTADALKVRLGDVQRRVARVVADLGGDLRLAREQAQLALDDIVGQLSGLQASVATTVASAATALENSKRSHAELELQLSGATVTLNSAASTRSDAAAALATLDTEAAALRGQLTAINRLALEQRLNQARSNPVFAPNDEPQVDLPAAKAAVDRLQQLLDRCTNDLNHAKGQLHLIAGHVGTERLAQQQEAVNLAHAEVFERERAERAALRLLREIESAEEERATHLGRALSGPITEAFRGLTGGRYGAISLAPDLRTENVDANGAARTLEDISVGTREQLATLLRLAIAGYLQTAIVLDDQLVHSDSGRLAWFKGCLRDSARTHNHQVIVFTCRPADYLGTDDADDGVTAVDLAALVV